MRLILSLFIALAAQTAQSQSNCHGVYRPFASAYEFETKALANKQFKGELPDVVHSFGTKQPILRSFEKEGLFYAEIAQWFPSVKQGVEVKISTQLAKEQQSTALYKKVEHWLRHAELDGNHFALNPKDRWILVSWDKVKDPAKRWQMLTAQTNFFKLLSLDSRAKLFENSILNFNDILKSPEAPDLITVGDDGGSYEVRMRKAVPSRAEFESVREISENYLEGKVGHQHIFHTWPADAAVRKEIAPYYIELLDASTWYLYTRQLVRDPENVSSLLVHPFLGIYSTATLNKLHNAMVNNRPDLGESKFNMVGARRFAPLGSTPEQRKNGEVKPEDYVTDWELRSGPKTSRRDFIENSIEARLVTGDYSGLRDFRSYDFNTLKPIEEVAKPFATPQELGILKRFAKELPEMRDAHYEVANNHYRKRILAPLFNWRARLNLEYKIKLVTEAQSEYAADLIKVARSYIAKISITKDKETLQEAREDAITELEFANHRFYTKTRLDQDLEKYLRIKPGKAPSPLFTAQKGDIDVNTIGLGIEYSVRFPLEVAPETKGQAASLISALAKDISVMFGPGTKPERVAGNSHGHNLIVKYNVKDATGAPWRIEWDGIARNYSRHGNVTQAWGGHVEIVSPKFTPTTIEGPIQTMFQTARNHGMIPNCAAGGGHVNFDVGFLQKLPAEIGTRKISNLISYFESNQNVMLHLWMHPKRTHAAYPVKLREGFSEALKNFKGTWNDYGRLLYNYKYFNTYKNRKPKYIPLNLTALMTEIVPREYIENTLDIKNPTHEWFPNFGDVKGRGEARFFDAPMDESMAALQIRYWRAVMNKAFNSSKDLEIRPVFTAEQAALWKTDAGAWKKAVESHLRDLGLDPADFMRLIVESFSLHSSIPAKERELQEHEDFLPPRTQGKIENKIEKKKSIFERSAEIVE